MRTADHEPPRGVDVILRSGIHHVTGHHRIDDVFLNVHPELFGAHGVIVLGRDDHRVDARRLAVDVLHAHLALAVRTQIAELAEAANLAKLPHQLVRHHDGQRHQFLGLIAGVTEHQALVARAAGIHAHGDIGRLALDRVQDPAGLGIEAHPCVGEADIRDHLARQPGHIHISFRGDFPSYHADARRHQNFASHAARRIVGHHRV